VTPFAFSTAAQIHVGPGAARRALSMAPALGRRAFVVTGADPGRAAWLTEGLAGARLAVAVHPVGREPVVDDARAAVAAARAHGADLVLAIGGGAALDLGKATAGLMREAGDPLDHLEVVGRGLPLTAKPPPLIAIPTTAGTGAEVTRNAVLGAPEHGRKVSLRDDRLLPAAALVDPDLLAGLPAAVALASGLDALVQVIEPFVSRAANPMTDALCREAIPRGLAALPRLLDGDPEARGDMALTSLFGGLALANAKLGAVHGLAGVIGGRSPVAHGAICGRLAGPVLAFTEGSLPAEHPVRERFEAVRGWIAAAWGGRPVDAFATWDRFADARGLPRLGLADPLAVATAAMASSSMQGAPVTLAADGLAAAIRDC
jgi:alcohol dehydrogenase class IV